MHSALSLRGGSQQPWALAHATLFSAALVVSTVPLWDGQLLRQAVVRGTAGSSGGQRLQQPSRGGQALLAAHTSTAVLVVYRRMGSCFPSSASSRQSRGGTYHNLVNSNERLRPRPAAQPKCGAWSSGPWHLPARGPWLNPPWKVHDE
jgi:hypothetical protein